tara:strand:- start:221 stop:379 length:159 start_codon:yes stop_codon:yes gene_type:complete
MWLYFSRKYNGATKGNGWIGDAEIKHLCGDDNEYTKKAMLQIMAQHCKRFSA